jgi:acetyl esterase/lipase
MMKKYLLSILFAILALTTKAQLGNAEIGDIPNKYLDIPYATLSEAQKLDIYLPTEGEGPFPVIIAVHGGGFLAGDKRDRQLEPKLNGLGRGYAVVSINYRLSPEATWPAQIHDCKAAVRWLRANASAYQLDPDNMVAWGGSAGGHLSSMLGTSGDVAQLEDLDLGNPDQSSRVQAVVNWFGPTDFLQMDKQLGENQVANPMRHSIPDSPESKLLGADITQVPDLVKEADPTTWVSVDDPPFLIQHGTEDNLVPYQGSVILARELGKAIGHQNVHLELFPDTGHGNGPAFYTNKNINEIFAFLDTHLKKPKRGTLEIDGFKIHYLVKGEGIPCLVIGSSIYYPRTFSQGLSEHLKMYFVDMPWFASERGAWSTDSMSIEKINGFVEEIRRQLKLEKPLLMGHSIHGTIAMEYAKAYPEKLSGLVMIGSPNMYGNEAFSLIQTKAWERASANRKELQQENWRKLTEIRDQFSPSELIVEEYCTMGPSYWNNPHYDARKLWAGMTIHADLLRHLYSHTYHNYNMFGNRSAAPVPSLVFLGRQDFAIPPELWEKDKNVSHLDLIVLNHSGHTPQLEEQRLFDRELIQWLIKCRSK